MSQGAVDFPPLAAEIPQIGLALCEGALIPFLGAGVNLCERPPTEDNLAWEPGDALPSGSELTNYLAKHFLYPDTEKENKNLLRVTQFVRLMRGDTRLYQELRAIFVKDYPVTALHEFLAKLPAQLRAKGYWPRQFLIVTTNYDDVLERAFAAAGEPFDTIIYAAKQGHPGWFVHCLPGQSAPVSITDPTSYKGLLVDAEGKLRDHWNVILKIHGAVDRDSHTRDSFVITEDDYIDYLAHDDVFKRLPHPLPEKLKESSYLYLGYSLSDWNLRVLLRRIWRERALSVMSWAVEQRRKPLDERFWSKWDVTFINAELKNFARTLGEHLVAIPEA